MNTLDVLSEAKLVDGAVVIEVPVAITADTTERIRETAQRVWPDRKVLVLSDGIKVSHAAQLDRIEEKLDQILNSMPRGRPSGLGPG